VFFFCSFEKQIKTKTFPAEKHEEKRPVTSRGKKKVAKKSLSFFLLFFQTTEGKHEKKPN